MKKFSVNVHYDFYASVDVEAETEEEALEKAERMADEMSVTEFECSGMTGKCVTNYE
ncbi:MAG: hypothetical protein MJ237_06015 [bacterium]|nr:hypothetical protein [bacterium]